MYVYIYIYVYTYRNISHNYIISRHVYTHHHIISSLRDDLFVMTQSVIGTVGDAGSDNTGSNKGLMLFKHN